MSTRNAGQLAEADTRVRSWASLSPEDRQRLLSNQPVRPLRSGGALLTVNGVDRWSPSWRDALDELAAHSQANP